MSTISAINPLSTLRLILEPQLSCYASFHLERNLGETIWIYEWSPFIGRLTDFLDRSPTPWHAVANISELLEVPALFILMSAQHGLWRPVWHISLFGPMVRSWHGGTFGVVGWTLLVRIRIVQISGAPEPIMKSMVILAGLEVYGGVLLSTWFDRDLSLAGRVAIANEGCLSELVDFERAVGVIPSGNPFESRCQ